MTFLPWKFFRKLIVVQIASIGLILVVAVGVGQSTLESHLIAREQTHLKNSLAHLKKTLAGSPVPPDWCRSQDPSRRYTLINPVGKVLCDNHTSAELLENHLQYPEVAAALRNGYGSRVRFLKGRPSLYGAISLSPQKLVLRQTLDGAKLADIGRNLKEQSFLFFFVLFGLVSAVCLWTAFKVSRPLNSVFKRIDKIRKLTHEDPFNQTLWKDDWVIVEKTLDQAQKGLRNYIEKTYNETEKMTTVMESITDSILAIGLGENVLFANKPFKKDFLNSELRKTDIARFKMWEINRNSELQSLFKKSLKNRSVEVNNMEFPIREQPRFFDVKVNPLLDQNGEVFGAVGIFRDVTERRMAEQMREDFVVNVSHEVRTPLTAMKGFVQLLKSSRDNPDRQDLLNKIELNANRLTLLFNDILNLSVIESKTSVAKESVLLEDLTSTVIANIRQSYPDKKIAVDTRFEIEKAWANPALLEQVVTNLIENAYKYTTEDSRISVKWSRESDNNGRFDTLTIRDRGLGIPQEHLPRIFERFYRIDPSRTQIGGTGLGLAIVKHIVEAHTGKIFVNSRIGQGSTFSVQFPAHH